MTPTALNDRELVDLLAHQPDLLAIADAIAGTRVRRRRRRGPWLAAAAVAVAAGTATLVLGVSWRGHATPFPSRALAAVGDLPVIHAVFENTAPAATVIDLATGKERPEILRTEYWYDAARHAVRARMTIDGRFVTEYVATPDRFATDLGTSPGSTADTTPDPALAGFASRYRDALRSGDARVVGRTTVDGRKATLLQFETAGGSETVAVADDDYRPLQLRWNDPRQGTSSPWVRVVSIGSIARTDAEFAPPPRSAPRPTAKNSGTVRSLTPTEAAAALGGQALWPGSAVNGVPLRSLELQHVTVTWTDGSRRDGEALQLAYGSPGAPHELADHARPFVVLTEAASEDLAPTVAGGEPPLAPGEARIEGRGEPGRPPVIVTARVGDVYAGILASDRNLALAAARALRPIAQP
jgi:hypothetical protein